MSDALDKLPRGWPAVAKYNSITVTHAKWYGGNHLTHFKTIADAALAAQCLRAEQAEAEVERWKRDYDTQAHLHEKLCVKYEETQEELDCMTIERDSLTEDRDDLIVERDRLKAELAALKGRFQMLRALGSNAKYDEWVAREEE